MRENYPYRGVKGMRDVFPEDAARYHALEALARDLFGRFGFGEIRTPLVEHTVLFERGIGQGTDIVNKEMFYIPAKDQDEDGQGDPARRMVLRPEATASVVRAYVEHEIDKTAPGVQRYYYAGPMFRYERPQRGRLRQFNQIGTEMLGSGRPAADAESIILLVTFLRQAGLPGAALQINSVGCRECRPAYSQALRDFARQHAAGRMCADCQARAERNPLRLFDCKQAACREIMAQAPTIQDALCPACRQHQEQVLHLLQAANVAYTLQPRLVRGLDYYTRTVFELVSMSLGAQNAVAAGGRYDHLVEELGGPALPAIGWSAGVERLLELLPAPAARSACDVFVVAAGPDPAKTFLNVLALRERGVRVILEHEARSVKAMIKRADRLGARYALFVSEQDPDKLELKNMATGEQVPAEWRLLPEIFSPGAKG